MDDLIDWKFLEKREGRKLRAYVPKDKNGYIGKSGVTVGTGVDIGQMSATDIFKLDLPNSLKYLLLPYALKKREEADLFLQKNPLVLRDPEVDQLDEAIKKRDIARLQSFYNKDSKIKFELIPKPARTVLASLAWNFGTNLSIYPSIWLPAISQDWKKLATILEHFQGKQKQLSLRRKIEAALLRTIK